MSVTQAKLPEIEGLGIDVWLCEQGPDIVKATLHDCQMQSWENEKMKYGNVFILFYLFPSFFKRWHQLLWFLHKLIYLVISFKINTKYM